MKFTNIIEKSHEQAQMDCCKLTVDHIEDDQILLAQHFHAGCILSWLACRTLNRLKTGLRRLKDNLKKWHVTQEDI